MATEADSDPKRRFGTLLDDVRDLLEHDEELEAVQRAAEARELARAALGDGSQGYAIALRDLGLVLKQGGAYDAAERCYSDAIEILRKLRGDGRLGLAYVLNNLGELERARWRLTQAEPLFREALEIWDDLGPEYREQFARTLHNLGLLQKSAGKFADAESDLRRALDEAAVALGEGAELTARFRSSLASLYLDTAREDLARPLYEEAIRTLTTLPNVPKAVVASVTNSFATLYRGLADYERAEELYGDAIDLLRPSDDAAALTRDERVILASALDNLAGSRYERREFVGAAEAFREGIEIWQGLADRAPDLATSQEGLGLVLQELEHQEEAERLLRDALALRQAALGEDHPEVATSLYNLGSQLAHRGDYADAEPLYQRAETIVRSKLSATHPALEQILLGQAELYGATGRPDEALERCREASAIHARMLLVAAGAASEEQFLKWLDEVAKGVHTTLSIVLQLRPNSPAIVAEALDLVLKRKNITAEVVGVRRDAAASRMEPELVEIAREWKALKGQIEREAWSGTPPPPSVIAELVARAEELELELAREAPSVNLERRLDSVARAEVVACLPEDGVLVEMIRCEIFSFTALAGRWTAARYLALVVAAGAPDAVALADLGNADAIDALIAQLLTAISAEAEAETAEVSTRLRRAVFDPLLPHVGDRTRVVIAPDGELAKLPFEILRLDGERRVIDDYIVSYVSVGRDLLPSPQADAEPGPALVLADPDFDYDGGSGTTAPHPIGHLFRGLAKENIRWDPLTATREEGLAVGKLLDVEPVLGRDAAEPRVANAQSPRVLHLATHGFFLADLELAHQSPLLRSGVVLAGGNRTFAGQPLAASLGNGVLNAEDVLALDLRGTDLVVLSACDTALGSVRNGEGVFGLRRAFPLAGADTVVMSLWQVPDRETQLLMVDFYTRLSEGANRVEALRQSQLAIKAAQAEPFYWGAFICHGSAGPLAAAMPADA
jgi:CHAT domain-containing protein/tetratricopeptide (TPR) repeat protein